MYLLCYGRKQVFKIGFWTTYTPWRFYPQYRIVKSLKYKISFGLETDLPPSNKSGKDQTGQLGPIADGFIDHHSYNSNG